MFMKNFLVLLVFVVCLGYRSIAQEQDAKTLHETARNFMKQGDYSNAVLVLNRALQQEPESLEILKDLAFTRYLQKDYPKASELIEPLLGRKDADVQVYQVAGMIYNGKEDGKESEKLYKRGLKRFPNSGVLYNEYGELLWYRKDYNAIAMWERGIEADPNFAGNYYNAAKYYYLTTDKIWSIVYSEIFVNLESYSRRTIEVKNILLNSYKKLFTETDLTKNQNNKNEFTAAYLAAINRQSSLASMGITPESLTMIRTRFVLDWDEKYASRFPFRLFEYHRQLLREGLFEAYNQWLFGPVQNLTAFQNWTTVHAESYKTFSDFQRGRVFKLPGGQNYQGK